MSIRKEAEELRAHFITHDEEHHECRHCGKLLCEFGDRVSNFRRHALQCESLMKSVSAKASCSAMTTQGESGGGTIRAERCFVKLAQMIFLMTKPENVTNVWTQSSN
jgi:hypothetical protein